jgi:hypothetical protein
MKLLLCNFLHFSVTSSLLRPNTSIILSTLFCNTLSLSSSFSVKDRVPHPYKITGNIFIYMSILMFLEYKLEQEESVPNNSKHCLTSICALFLHEYNFDLLQFVPKYFKYSSLSKDLLPQGLVEYVVKIFTLDVPFFLSYVTE